MQKSKKIIYAFIDSQNLNLAIRDQGWVLDFKKFFVYLKDKYKITKAFLFIGYVPGNEMLYANLQESGFIIILKPTTVYSKNGESFIKGNVDAELVLHAMIQYTNYDLAIIVSGDGDFRCLIEYLADNNKLSHVMIPNPKKYSALLRVFRKYFCYMHQLNNKLSYKRKERE